MSDKQMQLIMENWRKLKEGDSEPQVLEEGLLGNVLAAIMAFGNAGPTDGHLSINGMNISPQEAEFAVQTLENSNEEGAEEAMAQIGQVFQQAAGQPMEAMPMGAFDDVLGPLALDVLQHADAVSQYQADEDSRLSKVQLPADLKVKKVKRGHRAGSLDVYFEDGVKLSSSQLQKIARSGGITDGRYSVTNNYGTGYVNIAPL